MKTLIRKHSNVSLYLLADDVPVNIGNSTIYIGGAVDTYVCDCNLDNTVLHENITAPDDWKGCKYLFDGTTWALNPDWAEPTPPTPASP